MAIPGSESQQLLEEIADWGNTTTIILHGGSVFEFKGNFPQGSLSQGYYNLKGETGFEGHLHLDSIHEIQFQEKAHRGKTSYALVFSKKNNDCIFKIFIGRDNEGELISHQVTRFKALQNQYQ